MKAERKNYVSPFPRTQSNNNVLKVSRPITVSDIKNSNNAMLYFEIPPSITKSYMTKNSFYFDVKHYKTNTGNTSPSIIENKRPKSSLTNKINNKTKYLDNFSHLIVEKSHIENLVNGDKKLLLDKPVLSPKKDVLKGTVKSLNNYKLQEGNMTSKEIMKKLFDNKETIKFGNKNFGAVPEYINEFKVRQTIEKEYERLIEEEKTYPPGTMKLFELERVNILNKLYLSKEGLLDELSKFPITSHVRSIKIQKQKAIVENKIEEVEFSIRTFERNKVFLKK